MNHPSIQAPGNDPCVIDVFEAARIGATCRGEVPAARLGRLRTSVASVDAPAGYRWTGTLDRRGDSGGRLEFEVLLTQQCDLCGGHYAQRMAVRREFRFAASEKELARRPIEPDDEIDWLLGSVRFDLANLIDEEAVLALPVSPRHPGCQSALEARSPGAAEAGGDAGCRPGPMRSFAALARLKPGPH